MSRKLLGAVFFLASGIFAAGADLAWNARYRRPICNFHRVCRAAFECEPDFDGIRSRADRRFGADVDQNLKFSVCSKNHRTRVYNPVSGLGL